MPNAASRCATRTPMRPSPTTPRVFSKSSTPVYAERFHEPPLSEACACGTRRGAGGGARGHGAGGGEHERVGVPGRRDDVGGRRVDDHDAGLGGGADVDVVEA